MRAHRLAWLASLALMAVGGVVAHALAYRLVAPDAHAHHHGGTFAHLQFCMALCATVVLLAAGASLFGRARALRRLRTPIWLVALLPPVGFAIQEHLERLIHSGSVPYGASLETVFLVGIVLQLPFALAAYLAARALVTLAVAVVERLRAVYRPRLVSLSLTAPMSVRLHAPRERLLAGGLGGRAPPVPAVG
jgi:hypothetical protein